MTNYALTPPHDLDPEQIEPQLLPIAQQHGYATVAEFLHDYQGAISFQEILDAYTAKAAAKK